MVLEEKDSLKAKFWKLGTLKVAEQGSGLRVRLCSQREREMCRV